MRITSLLVLALLLVCTQALSSTLSSSKARAKELTTKKKHINRADDIVVEKVLAHVNDSVITLSKFEYFYNYLKESKQANANIDKKAAMQLLIERELLLQLAKTYNVDASPKEIEEELRRVKEKSKVNADAVYSKDNEAFIAYEIKVSKNRNNLLRYIVKSNLITRADDKEIRALYKDNKDEFYEKEQFLVSHILIKLSREDTYNEFEAKEKLIKDILALIQDKIESFISLAKKYSDDLDTKYKGGRIGWYDIDTLSEIQPTIASTILKLKVGQVSNEIISSASGYHVVKLLDKKKERQVSFLEAKRFISNKILLQKANKQLFKMIAMKEKQSYIDIYF